MVSLTNVIMLRKDLPDFRASSVALGYVSLDANKQLLSVGLPRPPGSRWGLIRLLGGLV